MKKSIKKMMSILLIAILAIVIIPSFTHATDQEIEAVILEKNDGSKIIYIKGMDSTDFKYAFSDSETEETLDYTTCKTDTNGENVAYLESGETYNYMFISDEETEEIIDLSSLQTITEDEIEEIKTLTTRILVDTDESISYETTAEDGTSITTTLGQIIITDDETYTYQYQLIEIVDTNDTAAEINATALELYEQLSALQSEDITMYERLIIEITIRDDFKELLESAEWTTISDMVILQPEDSQEGEKYVVLIQKLDGKEVVENDVQFMTCDREDDADVEYTETSETKIVEKKTALPVTGEALALYISLVIVILAIVIVSIKLKKAKGKYNAKH